MIGSEVARVHQCARLGIRFHADPDQVKALSAEISEFMGALIGMVALAEAMNDASDEGGQLDERHDAAVSAIAKAVQP